MGKQLEGNTLGDFAKGSFKVGIKKIGVRSILLALSFLVKKAEKGRECTICLLLKELFV